MPLKSFTALALASVIAISQILTVKAKADTPAWSDSGVKRPKYETIVSWEDQLQKEFSTLVRIVDYGKSPKGLPLRLLIVKKAGTAEPHPTMIMSGSTHGNEYLNIEDRLPEEILRKAKEPNGVFTNFINEGGAFVFVPILNPDGFAAGTRENSHLEDLNRDWSVKAANFEGFHESETRLLSNALENLKETERLTYRVSVDYHCCAGALLYPWSFKEGPGLPEEVLNQFKVLGQMATAHLGVEVGRTGDVLGYSPKGTTKDYYYSRYGTLALTYEGKFGSEPSQLNKHVEWWEDLVRFLRGESNPRLLVKRRPAPKAIAVGSAD